MQTGISAATATMVAAPFLWRTETANAADSATPPVDFQSLVSRADLTYTTPVSRSEEGMPIGNGKMGTLIWTTPSAIKMQINRADVCAENCETHSFPERHTDYGSGCGYVDIDFGDAGDDVFAGSSFRQHLAAYDGLVTVAGAGVTCRVLASRQPGVIALEIDDQRTQPEAIRIDLRMLRYRIEYLAGRNAELASEHTVLFTNRNHSAASRLEIRQQRIALQQQYREGDYYNGSAVVAGVVGRRSKARYANDSTVRLSAAPGRGRFLVLIASASSFDANQDVITLALADLEAAAGQSFDALASKNADWWRDFWSRSYVQLRSADGEAQFVEQNYTYLLYLMGSSSAAEYPPRFGGLLWFTNGDMREWGSQHWWANVSCYYNALPPVNRMELMDPVFSMYTKMLASAKLAAQQEWGSQGIYIPETVWFDGLEKLPEDIAAEMRDLYLVRKPWEQRSTRFQQLADTKQPHNSRWNWKGNGKWVEGRWEYPDKGAGPFGQVNHIFSSQAKIAHLYWLRYEYTQNLNWLRDRAYPMVRGVAEFYRNFPNMQKGADGKYHIHNVNNHEPVWGAQDTAEELGGMHGILPLAIRGAELLQVDAELRPRWQELLQNLAALSSNDSPGAEQPRKPGESRIWISGLPPARHGDLNVPSLVPALYYDLCTIETADQEMVKTTSATYDRTYPNGVGEKTPISVLNRNGTAAAHLGRAADIRHMLPNQLRCLDPEHDFCDWAGGGKTGVLRNRMELREGPGAIDAERIGRMAQALHTALLQSAPPAPGQAPVIHVFPAWPQDWDAEYSLLARGAFLVTTSIRNGEIPRIEILSNAGSKCLVRNPWKGRAVALSSSQRSERLNGSLLAFQTTRGEKLVLKPV